MSDYTEFQGKTLDLAINAACTFFDVSRDKLEIEIVNDAKSGIFGLVGVKKATIRAKRMNINTSVFESSDEKLESSSKEKTTSVSDANEKRSFDKKRGRRDGVGDKPTSLKPRPNNIAKTNKPTDKTENSGSRWAYLNDSKEENDSLNTGSIVQDNTEKTPPKQERYQRSNNLDSSRNKTERTPRRFEKTNRRPVNNKEAETNKKVPLDSPQGLENSENYTDESVLEETAREGFAFLNVEEVGVEKVIEETRIVVSRLVDSIVEDYSLDIEIIEENKIKVMIDAGDSSGLLIGRYSQTLTAIQYMAARILTRVFNATTRIQIDAGDYRERQDEKMRELALSLAQRVKEEGRGLYTRPLSSYHRRVVHMVLQDDTDLQTRSKGEGAMKRILILPKRK